MPALIFASFILSGMFVSNVMGESAMQSVKGKKAVMIIAQSNFRDEELLKPKEVLEKNGVIVTVASSSLKESTGMLGAKVKPNILFTNINVADYDAVIFVGGSEQANIGITQLPTKLRMTQTMPKKIVGAICMPR